ncbi:hypothetical protein GDO86_020159 [Hymenochirus boettgeri]|uniref:NADP-dependent oxidoreductase domain-containing protein n=1 Tax=Hymenochirus boettgeri TaxID=247094 RepID=A0A8T2IKX9_9PIPI|nr:hypothetical protein GDO86_020159 [Hymenochirus boettgeri]
MYGDGETERVLGSLGLGPEVKLATKANPWDGKTLKAESVRQQLETSLQRLKTPSVHLFYLHAPDHQTPIEETLAACQQLYQQGKFKELGLSNYTAWEVMEIYCICKHKNWVLPTVYQGMYNATTRQVETELLPCLRQLGMRFYAYNPLAGGLLTGKYKYEDKDKDKQPADSLEPTGQKHTGTEVLKAAYGSRVLFASAALRWMYHHSQFRYRFVFCDIRRQIHLMFDGIDSNTSFTWRFSCFNRGAMEMVSFWVCPAWSSSCRIWLGQKRPSATIGGNGLHEAWNMVAHDCPNYFR